ncbi:MAG: enoyl-CoA hydratase/isomerase family protein [Caulobacterales bacterium]
MFECIGLTYEGPIARLEFRRPEAHNAFNAVMHREFCDALTDVRLNMDARVLILQAQGKTFLGGGDFEYLKQLREDPDLQRRTQREALDIFGLLNSQIVPMVAAVHGHALGFGATIVTSCDVIVAWKLAKLGDPHVVAGIVAGDGSVLSWSSAAGATRAKRMLLTGDMITAQEAYAFGLVTDLVDEPAQALPAAEAIAKRIAALPPVAVQGTKKVFNSLAAHRNGSVIETSLLAEQHSFMSEDAMEALDAAINKRPGNYRNR